MHLKWGSNGEMKQLSDTQCLPAPATQAGLIYYQKSGYREFIPSRQTQTEEIINELKMKPLPVRK